MTPKCCSIRTLCIANSTNLTIISGGNWRSTSTTHFLVGFPMASSMAQETVPRWSQPYASTPRVLPSNFLRLHCLCIDLSKGSKPRGYLLVRYTLRSPELGDQPLIPIMNSHRANRSTQKHPASANFTRQTICTEPFLLSKHLLLRTAVHRCIR